MKVYEYNPLAELNQCILNFSNWFSVNIVYILQRGQCTNFADDSGKQSFCTFSVVPNDS